MADLKISELSAATDLAAAEFEIIQGGTNKRAANTLLYTPPTSDGAALGTTALQWSDLFLASGGTINFNSGNYTLTHSAGVLTASGAFSIGTGNALTAGTIELGAASDTTISRGAAGFIAVEGNRVPSPASQAAGDIIYRGTVEWERLPKGTASQVLTMNSGATAPEWAAAPASGWDMNGQTWVVTARTSGTSYQNTSGKPIMVVALRDMGTSSTFSAEVSENNSTWVTIFTRTTGSGSGATGQGTSFIVQPNWYYRVSGGPNSMPILS